MMDYTLDIVHWRDIKDKMFRLNADIAQEIDALPNAESAELASMPFVRARLPFGAAIEKKSRFWCYYKNKPMPFDSDVIPAKFKALLDYPWKGIPVGMVMHNTLEWYVDLPSHTIPIKTIKPGTMMSLYSIFEPAVSHVMYGGYSSAAGCRSLLMLPKVSHKQYNERLAKAFEIHEYLCPKNLSEQWGLFQEICTSKNFDDPWYCEIILFSRQLLEHLRNRFHFRHKLMSQIWDFSAFSRNYVMYDLLWNEFAQTLPKSTRNTPFILETAKHVIKAAMRVVPCYAPATNNLVAPIHSLTKAFLDVYRIRYYLPIFMQPEMYNGRAPVYYSLHKHTFFHPIPDRTNANRTINEMTTIQQLVTDFAEAVNNNAFNIDLTDTVLYQTLQEVSFDFFHPQGGSTLRTDIDSIPKDDKRFMKIINEFNIQKELSFPDHSIFFNGCIRIQPKERTAPKPSMNDFLSMISSNKSDG